MVYDYAPHCGDQILRLVNGRLASVFAATHSMRYPEVDDHFCCCMHFAGGATAYLEAGNNLPVPDRHWYVVGSRGCLTADTVGGPVRLVPQKGEELSREYYREGMRQYVGIDEDASKGPVALLDFMLAAELDPGNGEAIYKAACVAAKRNALALAAELLKRAFEQSVTFKARAKDDDNFSEMIRSPSFSDLFGH